MATTEVTGVFAGVPTYFRGRCIEARRGGTESYKWAGWHLAIHVLYDMPYDVSDAQWIPIVKELAEALDAGDDARAWKWFEDHYPRCAALIPRKRRQKFVEGARKAHVEDGRIL